MKMQEKFKQTFDVVHAPEDLLGKVMELHREKKEFKTRNLIKAAVCVLAVTMGVFAAGNGICYAATGESLVTKVKIIINGEEIQPMDMEWKKNGEEYTGSIVFPDQEGSSSGFVITTDENPEDVVIDIITEEKSVDDDKVEEVVVMEIDEEDASSIMYEKQETANSSEDMDDSE